MLYQKRINQKHLQQNFYMRKIFFVVALVAFTLTSCDKNEVEQTINQDEVKFGGLKVNLPPNYNEKVLSLSLSDLQNQFY